MARAIAFVLLTGVLAVVIIATLLLLGVEPRLVFMPGFTVQSWLKDLGFRVPNRVGVLTTVLLVWGFIVAIRFVIARVARSQTK